MHTATQLDSSHFEVRLSDQPATVAELFPAWALHDRFGILVHEPFGALGANLLIQAAITSFYDAAPERRCGSPSYPEIYAFHVGGRSAT